MNQLRARCKGGASVEDEEDEEELLDEEDDDDEDTELSSSLSFSERSVVNRRDNLCWSLCLRGGRWDLFGGVVIF